MGKFQDLRPSRHQDGSNKACDKSETNLFLSL